MKNLKPQHFDDALETYRKRDPQLHEELRQKFSKSLDETVEETAGRMVLPHDRPLLTTEGTPTVWGARVTEAIVRPNGRPVLVIRDNRATTEFLGPDSQVWAGRIQAAQALLDRAIPSVGRIELTNNAFYPWVGTGWLVADDVIVTNRHVAREFARLGTSGFVFRLGDNGSPQSARVDFLEEDQRALTFVFNVENILWIAPPREVDVAFLRVKRVSDGRALPPKIPLGESVTPDEFVVTIGYPARDPDVPDQDLVRQVFGDVYDKKRLAPGQVLAVSDDELQHDCSTLGGNSGSVVLSLRTGAAVALHYAGAYMQANYAVPSPKLRELLRRLQLGELPGLPTSAAPTPGPVSVSPPAAVSAETVTFTLQVPLEVQVRLGVPSAPGASGTSAPTALSTAPAATARGYEAALQAARQALAGQANVIVVRPGYRFKRGWITDERVIVVEVREKMSLPNLHKAAVPLIPNQFLGVGIDVRTAGFHDQLEHLGIRLESLEARARPGTYREPPDLSLDLVRERMQAIFHVSPDSGLPNLKAFFGRVQQFVVATMYEWDSPPISDAIETAMQNPGRSLKMVTQPQHGIAAGTEEAVDDMKRRIGDKFKHVYASVGSGKLIPSDYHIKVASRDGEEFWLSSGNWKDSNQPDIDPVGSHSTSSAPLREHNRDWHAIIANARLAELFQHYIEWDFAEAQRVRFEEAVRPQLPDLFVPEAAFVETESRFAVHYFEPLRVDRELEVQPLLTPDRDSRGRRIFMQFATEMVQGARSKIYVENQSFNYLGAEDDVEEFEDFFTVLRDRQRAGVDVRVIFRDPREYPRGASRLSDLLERLKGFGIDTDRVKVQRKCHTKGIIVDTAQVMLGSHNLTNAGSLYNRDASLLVRDLEVAAYFERVFLFDWDNLAEQNADELVGGMRLARPGETTPPGFRRVALTELLSLDS